MKKKKTLKKLLMFMICLTMVITFMPAPVYTFADDMGDAEVMENDDTAAAETATEAEGATEGLEEAKEADQAAEEAVTEDPSGEEGEQSAEKGDAAEEPETSEAPVLLKAAEPGVNTVVHITNVLNNSYSSVNGHAVACERTTSLSGSDGSKAARGFYSFVGGQNRTAGGLGADYKFLNEFVLATEDSGPVFWETASDGDTISRVRFADYNDITVEFKSGATQTFDDCADLYISPVYKQTIDWYLIYNYVDRVSTGSGSWSNLDFVTSYSHTYSDPSEKTPVAHYKFVNWKNTETGDTYEAGDTHSYNGAEQPSGSTKTINIYAMWQPSVTINYHTPDGVESEEDFADMPVYDEDHTPAESGNIHFDGWYDSEGNRISEDTVYEAPEITGADEEVTQPAVYDVYARFYTSHSVRKEWNDQDDKDSLRKASVDVRLLANGEEVQTVILSERNNWSYTFSDLDAYDSNYKLIEYSAEETTDFGDDYTTAVTQETDEETGAVTSVITNTLIPKITIKAADDSKVYDGKELVNSNVEIISGSLFEGDELVATATGSATDVADTYEGNNVIEDGDYKIIRKTRGEGETDVTDMYNITREPGTLTITPAPLTIKTSSATKAYDGKPLTSGGHEIIGLVEGDTITVTTTGSQTEVGTSKNTYTISWDAAKEDNYTVSDELGDLTVTEAPAKGDDGSPKTGDDGFGFELTMLFGSAAALMAMLEARRKKIQ